jgi:hypothetical protein
MFHQIPAAQYLVGVAHKQFKEFGLFRCDAYGVPLSGHLTAFNIKDETSRTKYWGCGFW